MNLSTLPQTEHNGNRDSQDTERSPRAQGGCSMELQFCNQVCVPQVAGIINLKKPKR
jgi:hypothetical protein